MPFRFFVVENEAALHSFAWSVPFDFAGFDSVQAPKGTEEQCRSTTKNQSGSSTQEQTTQ